jgi:hypothetical protein
VRVIDAGFPHLVQVVIVGNAMPRILTAAEVLQADDWREFALGLSPIRIFPQTASRAWAAFISVRLSRIC